MKNIIGTKIGMTRIFNENGLAIPVTVIKVDKCRVVGKKVKEKDSYEALKIGYSLMKTKNANKPYTGQFKTLNLDETPKFIVELKAKDLKMDEYELGQVLNVDMFNEGDFVDITGISKGKGFAGVMKRHGFGGLPASHGHGEYRRASGSIGASSQPSRVFKNTRMAGRFGGNQVTLQKLEVVKIYKDENILLVKGAVPGIRGSYLKIKETSKFNKQSKKK